MRAAVYRSKGPARDVLDVVNRPDPEPGPGEVRVRVRVSGVNPTDVKSRAGGPELDWPEQIPDQDGAGEIDAVGQGVAPARQGERVWIYHAAAGRRNGTAAQFTCVPAEQAVPLPEQISFDQGAGVGIPGITARHCLYADGGLDGQTVLVTGGAGAVGHTAIELARWGGARVIATVSSEEKARLAAAAGAHVVLNYRDPDYLDRARAAAPDGVRRIVDVAVSENLETDLAVLAPHGVIVSYASGSTNPSLPVRALMTGNVTLRFVLVYNLTAPMLRAAIDDVTTALTAGALTPLPEHHFRLDDIAAAHEAVEQGAVGKVLVDIP